MAASVLLSALQAAGIDFVTGVPDSLLKPLCHELMALPDAQHCIAANEGAAVGQAIGHYLATSRPALVYMQNSGLGNAINPLVSLADPLIYAVPMVLLIGWRGELNADGSQCADEPQHQKQGQVTLPQLDTLDIPWQLIEEDQAFTQLLRAASEQALQRSGPVALVVRKGVFSSSGPESVKRGNDWSELSREQAIAALLPLLDDTAVLVSTTGMASRELFELRKYNQQSHQRDFLTVGGMGHALSIATAIARQQPQRQVVCLDGDGALVMQMGAMAEAARQANLLHIVLNNAAHDSVGGQPTCAAAIDLLSIAQGFGYQQIGQVASQQTLQQQFITQTPGSRFIELRCQRGHRPDLGRPDRSPRQNRDDFMYFLKEPLP